MCQEREAFIHWIQESRSDAISQALFEYCIKLNVLGMQQGIIVRMTTDTHALCWCEFVCIAS